MAGLVPAIHVLLRGKTWMPGTSPGMTELAFADLPHAHLTRELVELRLQRIRQRNAVAQALGAAGTAALAGEADGVEAGQAVRGVQVVHVAVDLGLEGIERDETLDVDRADEVARVGRAGVVGVEVDHVLAEGGAVEDA